ncbi:MAG: macrolide ABC transporter ATP-binding protein [Candidatus Magasanikbacteria bacterium CG_4_9_14_0_2_um_filter_42_11]|uniref:Macrolide ABC transporter ATP-binding protein n=1 Tax=Candidatus Magasanikbacteria bacterium CG_4_9_14_0_2_um_filter_42_11 TaxID=1974643 RepID=A0A2M8FAD0_9BACT|nr:MAG: macrolide ABC transporter ATP-binding protein [Candidatus Magasanikbacteria bacterium CG10_big_fil_rev_8_21_14_0_10_43_9]PIY92224.1 MAG: macrolide ABC transporter ATP-binding protein [Candidatus Magasanikbacteria bacterium CG_4_10_14_0_8_um_filter_42_12]PJC52693.1 MAG: macrolide ABC transporter ATP-binding protein [Candidatus Magasanikbacteria bacterium CG_4_9_14_0_2_um_filter_42_11]
MPLIEVKGVTKTYVTGDIETPVLHGIDLTIEKGDYVAIMGPSGSGKSTFMHILSFLDNLTTGTYFFEDTDVSTLSSDKLAMMRNEKIGFIFQAFNLLPRTTVYDNVALPLLYSKKERGRKEVESAIASVELSHRITNISNQLSGGEKQRVAIARAIVNDPDVIFADEPTGNLDSKTGTQIMRILQRLNNEGRTVIMVTHEQDTADHAKRIVLLRDGLIEKDAPVKHRRFAEEGEIRK